MAPATQNIMCANHQTAQEVTETNGAGEAGEFWLFGYGSLIWKPPPHYDRRVPGYIEGYVRRFWQDHRGTPEAPGRVVTLIEWSFWNTLVDEHAATEDRVWGTAYRIKRPHVAEVKAYLDIREINGYSIRYTDIHPADPSLPPIRCMVYIGLPSNDQFVGPQDPQKLAEHIWESRGPSGENKEYLFMLEKALRDLDKGSGDRHVEDLAARVKAIEKNHTRHIGNGVGGAESEQKAAEAVELELSKVGSTDEQEEVEKLQ